MTWLQYWPDCWSIGPEIVFTETVLSDSGTDQECFDRLMSLGAFCLEGAQILRNGLVFEMLLVVFRF